MTDTKRRTGQTRVEIQHPSRHVLVLSRGGFGIGRSVATVPHGLTSPADVWTGLRYHILSSCTCQEPWICKVQTTVCLRLAMCTLFVCILFGV